MLGACSGLLCRMEKQFAVGELLEMESSPGSNLLTPRSQWLWAWRSLPASSFLRCSLCSINVDGGTSLGSTVSGGAGEGLSASLSCWLCFLPALPDSVFCGLGCGQRTHGV